MTWQLPIFNHDCIANFPRIYTGRVLFASHSPIFAQLDLARILMSIILSLVLICNLNSLTCKHCTTTTSKYVILTTSITTYYICDKSPLDNADDNRSFKMSITSLPLQFHQLRNTQYNGKMPLHATGTVRADGHYTIASGSIFYKNDSSSECAMHPTVWGYAAI